MVKFGIHGHKHRHVARTLLAVLATVMQEQENDLKDMTQRQLHMNLAMLSLRAAFGFSLYLFFSFDTL